MIAEIKEAYQWWAQFGLGGAVIGTLFFYLFHLLKTHKDERQEWKQDFETLVERSERSSEKVSDALTEWTKAIQGWVSRGD